jgi:hypothetical protein
LECQSFLLNDFEAFLEKFGASFGDLDKERTTTNKLQALCQGSHPTFVYAFEFKQLTCDISWDEVELMNQFQFGLYGDMKDLLLTMLNPITLS